MTFGHVIVGVLLCVVAFALGGMFERRYSVAAIAQTDAAIKTTDQCVAAWLKAAAQQRLTGNASP